MNKQGMLFSTNSLNSCLSKTKQRIYDTSQLLAYSLLLTQLSFIPYVHAGPTGGNVVGGAGTINQSGLNTTINQSSSSMAINWDSYNLGANERVQYIQPGSSSISLNRILSHSGSEIHGRIDANGQVILVNPNGVFFGPTSQINVGGLIASGLDISPTDFMNGNYIFNEVLGTDGTVVNSGLINASLGGSVSLIGKQVKNEGVINAKLGAVNMAAGKQAVLTFDNQGLIGVKINKEILQDELGIDPALINSGEINAESGRVLLTASVSRDVFSQAVNTGDIEQASSVLVNADGSFSLGSGSDVVNSGSITVSSTGENAKAGEIVIIGENIIHTGVIAADTETGVAGTIELHANDKTELKENALLSAQALNAGSGGGIKILGNKVGLFDNTEVNTSGANGGGGVLIGGDREGLNNNIRNADFLFMSDQANVFADALDNGNGGRIIAYADDTGRFYGGLYARGGVKGGDGGFIETSGKQGFEILNAPDVSASKGDGGLWLIDPYNITIQNSGDANFITAGTDPTIYTSSGALSTIQVGTIRFGLSTGSVEIRTVAGDGGGENGDITFLANLDYDSRGDFNSSGSNTLTLNADGEILFFNSSSISDSNPSGDSLNLNLFAKGAITLNDGVVIDTQGGDFTVGGAGGSTPTSFTAKGTASIDTTGRDNTAAGNISITTSGAITTGALTANGGAATTSNPGSNGGNILLSASTDITLNGAISSNGSQGSFTNADPAGADGGNAGTITMTSTTESIIATNTLSALGGNGNGDDQTESDADPANGGNGADISLTANAGTISVKSVSSKGGSATGSDDFNNNANVFAQSGDAGSITFIANGITLGGDLDATAGDLPNVGGVGDAGAIDLTGNLILAKDNLRIDSGTDGSGAGNITITGNINSDASDGALIFDADNGAVQVTGSISVKSLLVEEADSVFFGSINTSRLNQNGGFVNIGSVSDIATSIITADINTQGLGTVAGVGRDGGDITFNAKDIAVGTLITRGSNASGIVPLTGGGKGGAIIIFADNAGGTKSITLNGDVNTNSGVGVGVVAATPGAITMELNGAGSGVLNVNNVFGFTTAFTVTSNTGSIDTINGPDGFTLLGIDSTNSWSIDRANGGILNAKLTFENFEDIIGGSFDDSFTFTSTGSISGLIDGGGANIQDTVDVSSLIDVTVEIGNVTNGNINIVDIEQVIANAVGNNTLIADSNNAVNDWNIDRANGGILNANIIFDGFRSLSGGSTDDTFTFTSLGSIAGLIDGGGANIQDTVDVSSLTDVTVEIGNVTNGNINIVDIEQVIANAVGNNTLIADSNIAVNDWSIDRANGGILNTNIIFDGFRNLSGGSTDDTFTFTSLGSIAGLIDGGGENIQDTVDVSSLTDVTVEIGNVTNGNINIVDIEQVIANAVGNNTLIADSNNAVNDWSIDRANGGILNTNIIFDGFRNLSGGSTDDSFTFTPAGSISGLIDGGGANIQDTVNVSSLTDVIVEIGNVTNGSINIVDIEQVIANAVGNNTLIADSNNAVNDWSIDRANGGILNTNIIFDGFRNLSGGSTDDTFTFTSLGSIAGLIDGGGENIQDTVDVSSLTDVTVEIGNVTNGNINIVDIEQVIANAVGNNTLIADSNNAVNDWSIDRANGGILNTNIIFDGFRNLSGGSTDDSFTFTPAGSISGLIDGGGANIQDTVNVSSLTDVIVEIGNVTNGNINIVDIEQVIANAVGNNTLIADSNNAVNDWNIDRANGGILNANIIFDGFRNLTGGNTVDTFNVTPLGSVTGLVSGGAGDDVMTVELTGTQTGILDFDGGVDNDTITLTGGSSTYTGVYSETLTDVSFAYADNANSYTVAYKNTETVQDELQANSLTVNGTGANDIVSLGTNTFVLGSGVEVTYSNKQNLIVAGLGGTDTVDIAGVINLPGILEINAEEFTNTSSSVIMADTLFLNSVNTAGLSGQRILTNVANLRLAGVTGDVFITETNAVDISELATTALFDLLVSAGNVTDSTGMVSNNTFNITANSGSIILDSANQLTGELSLSAPNGNITLNNSDTLLATVDTQDLSIISNSINNTLASQINVTISTRLAANGQDIVLNAVGHRFTDLTVSNTADLTLVDSSALTINSVNVTGNADITAVGNVQLNSIRAGNSTTVTTTAAIIDVNGSAVNVTADKVKLRAASGIGSGDAIETSTAELDVINSGGGQVTIKNTGNVLLTNLVNSGDIDFKNDTRVTIDHVDAGFTVGTFRLDVANGSVFGVDRAGVNFFTVPDITADAAFVTVNGEFGTFARPIVLKLNSEFFLASTVSSTFFLPQPPPVVNDTSDLQLSVFDSLNSVSGQRLIEIESLADINPAIFTDLHNYNQENISIRLPRDQMFDDELENYDRL